MGGLAGRNYGGRRDVYVCGGGYYVAVVTAVVCMFVCVGVCSCAVWCVV